MNLIQKLNRLGQQFKALNRKYDIQAVQIAIIKKLYIKNGLNIVKTCSACPEQYEVFKDGKQVGYLRLRHGSFRVDFPTCGGKTIYDAEPNGDGIFESNERLDYLAKAMRAILKEIELEYKP